MITLKTKNTMEALITQTNIDDLILSLSERAELVHEGEEKALQLFADLHLIEKAVKGLKSEICGHVIDEAQSYGKDKAVVNGYRISVSSRKNWVYEDKEVERLKALIKSRQGLMKKSLALNGEMYDENGEVIPPASFTESTFIKMEMV